MPLTLMILLLFFNFFSKKQALTLLFIHKVKSPEAASGDPDTAK